MVVWSFSAKKLFCDIRRLTISTFDTVLQFDEGSKKEGVRRN